MKSAPAVADRAGWLVSPSASSSACRSCGSAAMTARRPERLIASLHRQHEVPVSGGRRAPSGPSGPPEARTRDVSYCTGIAVNRGLPERLPTARRATRRQYQPLSAFRGLRYGLVATVSGPPEGTRRPSGTALTSPSVYSLVAGGSEWLWSSASCRAAACAALRARRHEPDTAGRARWSGRHGAGAVPDGG
jgi:hypothetical protein